MPGSLALGTRFATQVDKTDPVANLDTNFDLIIAYVNAREITIDVLANRPAAGTAGRYFLATDVNGGTLYVDTGGVWIQASAGSSQTAASVGLIASLPTPVPFR